MRRVLVLSLAVALWGFSAGAASANQATESPAANPVTLAHPSDPASLVDIARIEDTADSLSFSDSIAADEMLPQLDEGQGLVRSILQSPFGDTALAGFLFERRAIVVLLLIAGVCLLRVLFRLGARAQIELTAPALAMGGGRTLPLVGDDHPIERAAAPFSRRAAGIAVLLHLMLLGTWLVARNLPQPLPLPEGIHRIIDFMPPIASIIQTSPPEGVRGGPVLPSPEMGFPEPSADVPIFDPPADTPWPGGGAEGTGGDATGGGPDTTPFVVRLPTPPPTPPTIGEPVDLGAVPVLLEMPKPVYPETARNAEVQGTVTLQILVGEDGRVQDVKVLKGHPMLNSAAIQAARRAVFSPATQHHRPVAVWVEFPVRFTLY